jgi:hypothetical protein
VDKRSGFTRKFYRAPSFFSGPLRKEGGGFDFLCQESKSQWTYARGIPPFATNAKDGAPGRGLILWVHDPGLAATDGPRSLRGGVFRVVE